MKTCLNVLVCLLCVCPVFALPSAQELSTPELVGQTIMPRIVIGQHQAFKKSVQNGEVTGFFIKTWEGLVTHPEITAQNQYQFMADQRAKLLATIADLQAWVQESPRKIPLLLAIDYEGGTVTSPMYLGLKQMPSNMLLAAAGKEDLVAQIYAAQAAQLRKIGANVSLGPVVDVNSNPENPIIQTRSFGDQADVVGKFAARAVEGLQSQGIAAVPKHFPGHGDVSTDPHGSKLSVTDLPAEDLWQQHIHAFEAPLKLAYGVMTNHVKYPQLDGANSAIFSKKIATDLLKNTMGYKGLVLTDALDMEGVNDKPVKDIVLDGYAAGNDVLLLTGKNEDIENSVLYPRQAVEYVKQELRQKAPRITRAQLEEKVQKILDLKAKLSQTASAAAPDFDKISEQIAQEGVTQVRGKSGVLAPYQKICTIFFAGGIFSNQLLAFNQRLSGQGKKVTTVFAPVTPGDDVKAQALACIADAQAVVIGTSRYSALDQQQYQLVTQLLRATHKPLALISLLNPYEIVCYPDAKTVLATYGPTVFAMQTAADILLGNAPAKGKLPVRLPAVGKCASK